MRIATLGSDATLVKLVAQLQQNSAHRIVACFDAGEHAEQLARWVPSDRQESWEVLLSDPLTEVVLVASRPAAEPQRDLRAEQLRKLVQSRVPLLAIHPVCDMIVGLELAMIQRDSGCPIAVYAPMADHRASVDLLEHLQRLNAADSSAIEQVVWERFAHQRSATAVLDHFARDVLLLRRLLGEVSQVSAIGLASEGHPCANLGVHLIGSTNGFARWSIGPVQEHAGARLSLLGAGTHWTLEYPDDGPPRWVAGPGPSGEQETAGNDSWEVDRLQTLLTQLDGQRHGQQRNEQAQPLADWDEACRALEIEEAVQRGCRRGRTIELHHEQVTEQDTFKSMMAAGGCALLLWVLVLLILGGILEGLQLATAAMRQAWLILLIAPLAIFLALQLLQLFFKSDDSSASEP